MKLCVFFISHLLLWWQDWDLPPPSLSPPAGMRSDVMSASLPSLPPPSRHKDQSPARARRPAARVTALHPIKKSSCRDAPLVCCVCVCEMRFRSKKDGAPPKLNLILKGKCIGGCAGVLLFGLWGGGGGGELKWSTAMQSSRSDVRVCAVKLERADAGA